MRNYMEYDILETMKIDSVKYIFSDSIRDN